MNVASIYGHLDCLTPDIIPNSHVRYISDTSIHGRYGSRVISILSISCSPFHGISYRSCSMPIAIPLQHIYTPPRVPPYYLKSFILVSLGTAQSFNKH